VTDRDRTRIFDVVKGFAVGVGGCLVALLFFFLPLLWLDARAFFKASVD
jgi:hypothetical protein